MATVFTRLGLPPEQGNASDVGKLQITDLQVAGGTGYFSQSLHGGRYSESQPKAALELCLEDAQVGQHFRRLPRKPAQRPQDFHDGRRRNQLTRTRRQNASSCTQHQTSSRDVTPRHTRLQKQHAPFEKKTPTPPHGQRRRWTCCFATVSPESQPATAGFCAALPGFKGSS